MNSIRLGSDLQSCKSPSSSVRDFDTNMIHGTGGDDSNLVIASGRNVDGRLTDR